MFLAVVGLAVPSFVLAPLFQKYFGLEWSLLPMAGWGSFEDTILPSIALAFTPLALMTRVVRSGMLEVMAPDYIRTARAKGLTPARVITRHAIRNAILPAITIVGPLAVDIVTADGQLRHASAGENADLFWAVRGAGSNFGVITSFTFRLHPVGPTVMLCAALYALADAPAVLRKWRDYIATVPDEFTPLAVFWSVPEGFPPEIVGRPIVIIAGR